MKTISIIWAGAAGLMAAATLIEQGWTTECRILLFEKNMTPGKKVIISGWGRCNVTTSIEDKKILEQKYTRWWEFIRKAMGKFSPRKCREWFESHGVPLKIQEDLRVFPVSDDGRDIVGVFEDIFAKNRDRITLHYGEWVDSVERKEEEKYILTTPKGVYESDILIITTGWNAYSHTGSSGDGYAFARSLGHTVTALGPSLSSFLTSESWLHALSGLAFPDASIGNLRWPLLLTHFGISWPLAFMLSSELAFEKIEKWNHKNVTFSPLASMKVSDWEIFLKDQFQSHPKKFITTILGEKLPRRFAEAFVREYFAHMEETFAGSIARKDREKVSRLLGEWIPLTLLERRPGDEFVTAGGVDTAEIDPETMESRIQKNLYFAGEILNVDGYTGGFSLQICWSSGYAVGKGLQKIL
jgi:predicted Rossmann fold flavoprotein